MLNSLPISNKAYIGEWIKGRLAELYKSGNQGCYAFRRLYGEPVFTFACFSQMSRTERIRSLHKLTEAARFRFQAHQGLGVAYDADDERSGFDVCWLGGLPMETPEIRRLAEAVFPTPETLIANPFGEARPYTPPA